MTTVIVTCARCGKKLRGHPTVRGGYAVNRHTNRATGKRCSGFHVHALPPQRVAS